MSNLVTSMTVVIGETTYDLVPASGCIGCAFAVQCSKNANSAPEYNDYALCADLDVIYKKRKSK